MNKENNQPLFSAPASLLFQAPQIGKPNATETGMVAESKTEIKNNRKKIIEVPAEVTFAAPKIAEGNSSREGRATAKTRRGVKKAVAIRESQQVLAENADSDTADVEKVVSFQAPPTVIENSSEERGKTYRGQKKNPDSEGTDEEQRLKTRRVRNRRRVEEAEEHQSVEEIDDEESSHRRRRRRSRAESKIREESNEITVLKGSTRLEAKKLRRREGRKEGRRQKAITEAEFLARREAVSRKMLIRSRDGLNQIAILEDNILVEHYVSRHTQTTMVGSVFLGRVQNVLPSMEAAFVDLGKGRNAVLYAGEVNWEAAGLQGSPRRIEQALKSGDKIPVQVTKDPIGTKGARLTSQITLPGRYLVLVPGGAMTGISRKLPEVERKRLKRILKKIVPDDCGVIIRTAAEGATEEQLESDVKRLCAQWEDVKKRIKTEKHAPSLLYSEPELSLRVVRDVFNEDFEQLLVQGRDSYQQIKAYVERFAPDLIDRVEQWVDRADIFSANRIDEQLAKGMDRKVWLPSGGYLIIDRTEAMTVIDVNTGKYTGSGGTLEETITRNNLEAAEEIMRQLRLRDIGGIVVIDFVDMVLESNRDLVLRRLIECLGRDRTRHQVTEVTSLGLVQMTRKRVGEGLVEAFSTTCECCDGKGFIVHSSPVEKHSGGAFNEEKSGKHKNRTKEVAVKKLNQQAAKSIAQVVAASKQENENPVEATEGLPLEGQESSDIEAGKEAKQRKKGGKISSGNDKKDTGGKNGNKTNARPAARIESVVETQDDAVKRRQEAAKSVAEALSQAAQMLETGESSSQGDNARDRENGAKQNKVRANAKPRKKVELSSTESVTRATRLGIDTGSSAKEPVEKPKRRRHAAVSLPVVNPGENS